MKFFAFFLFFIFAFDSLCQNTDSLIPFSNPYNCPDVVDLRNQFPPIKNQGMRGSCAYFSSCSLIEYEFKKHKKDINISEQFLGYLTKRTVEKNIYGKTETSNVGYDLKAVSKYGLLQETHWPYQYSWFEYGYPCYGYEKNDSTPAICFTENRPPNKELDNIIKIKSEVIQIPSDIDSVIYFLGKENIPLAFLFPFNLPLYYKNKGHIDWSDSINNLWSEDNDGNHYMVLCGYDLDKQLFIVRNSWGESWGEKGYGTLSFYDFKKFCYYDLNAFKLSNPAEVQNINSIAPEEIKVNKFKVKTLINQDKSATIKTRGKLKNIGNHSVMIRSKLVYQDINSTQEVNDSTIKVAELSEIEIEKFKDQYIRCSWLYIPNTKFKTEKWRNNKRITLHISKDLMTSKTVQDLVHSGKYKFFIKTTLYTFNDIDGELKLDYKFQEVKL